MKKTTNKKPKICIVTWFHCLRNIKSAIAAWQLGYELELITQSNGYGLLNDLDLQHIYDGGIKIWQTNSQLEYALKKSTADIIWCHNEPDLMAEIANEVKGSRMVIHDCHDLPTLHVMKNTCPTCHDTKVRNMMEFAGPEKNAIVKSDYVFVPTAAYIDIIRKKYGDAAASKVKVVFSALPEMYYPEGDMPRVNGMLYCGQINVPEMRSNLPYRDVLPLFQKLTQLGIASHIYHTTPKIDTTPYLAAGACIHGTLRMFAAVHQYTRYDYGFVGSSMNSPAIQVCMPNKLFDCIAAGIPLICLNAQEAGRFIMKHDIGADIQNIVSFDKVPWHDKALWDSKRENVRKMRYDYTMEKVLSKTFKEMGI